MVGENFNYDNCFFRDLTVAVLNTLEGEIYWDYKFSSGTKKVVVPFYYSMTGDEKFLLDTFVDDIVSESRYSELNTDVIPRGILTWTGYDMLTDRIANSNVWVRMKYEQDDEVKNRLARIKPIPISSKYELVIFLNSENDSFKCAEAIMNTIGVYRYMAFQYDNINIMAVMQLPDSNQFEITRDKNMTSKNEIKFTITFEVITYYPAYRKLDNTNIRRSEGPTDVNTWTDAYTNDPFKVDGNSEVIDPKRTKWYSSIHKSNGNSSSGTEDNNI